MAERLGPPLDIDKALGKAKNRIHLVGVELEGGWFAPPQGRHPDRDGSVNFGLAGDDPSKVAKITCVGEIPLPPLSLREYPVSMKLYYPNVINKTCGMHVHLSTHKAFHYQRLMSNAPSYPATIVEYVKRWAIAERLPPHHTIWERLAGNNEYCQHIFQADEQVTTAVKDFDHHRPGHRYTVIGFCWSRHKTVECRLLPMMDNVAQSIKAVQHVIDITNAFLATSKEKERKYRGEVKTGDEIEVEERASYA